MKTPQGCSWNKIVIQSFSMAFRKTKIAIKPRKLKKNLFAKSWCSGASANWKIDYYDQLYFKRHRVFQTIDPYDESLGKK